MSTAEKTTRFVIALLIAGLLLLATGYWGAWIAHPAASLNILGIDLPEYVKFVPEVVSGQIPLKREVFFAPILSLATGLILLATIRRPHLPLWFRALVLILAIPTALAMLPPAWTPALLRTPEFRKQTIYILLILAGVVLSPLLYRHLPDWVRGVAFVLLGLLPFQALFAFQALLPALEKLYAQPLQPGAAYYLGGLGGVLLMIGGVLLLFLAWRQHKTSGD